jgi:hypothetical protein
MRHAARTGFCSNPFFAHFHRCLNRLHQGFALTALADDLFEQFASFTEPRTSWGQINKIVCLYVKVIKSFRSTI